MMTWRPYQWGDREAMGGQPLRPDLIPLTRTMVDDTSVVWGILGLMPYAPGTFEVCLEVRGGRARMAGFRALHEEWGRILLRPEVKTLIAFIDPGTEKGEALAAVGGLKYRTFFPSWWNGEPRVLMVREVR